MKVGFIGLGIMGKPMSKNLLKKGHDLVVCSHGEDAVNELVALGAKKAANGSEVAKECNVIITMLPNSPQVRDVCLGKGGIIEAAKPGTVVIDSQVLIPLKQEVLVLNLKRRVLN